MEKVKNIIKKKLIFDGIYLYNYKKLGKEYINGKLEFEGEYDDFDGELIFEGEYINGKRNGKGKEYYNDNKLIFEGEYFNDEKNGKEKML